MMIAIIRAFGIFQQKQVWRGMQKKAMSEDFSWNKSAKQYTHLFELAVGFKGREEKI